MIVLTRLLLMLRKNKVHSIVLATDQGLGYLAKDFYDHGIVDNVYIWPHSRRPTHGEWYPNRLSHPGEIFECDTLLLFETPFDWNLIAQAKSRGVKVIGPVVFERLDVLVI